MPRPSRNQARVRLNLEMTEQVRAQLEELRDLTQADSMTEVIRRALAVYDFLWNEKEDGATTIVRTKDGKEREVLLL